MNVIFKALNDPTRRAILELLQQKDMTAGEIADKFHISFPSISHHLDLLKQAKDVGEVNIQACALSMDMFGIGREDLDPIVDGIEGVAAFIASAADGQVVFI